jgi:hypothetical protein
MGEKLGKVEEFVRYWERAIGLAERALDRDTNLFVSQVSFALLCFLRQ